MIPIRNRRGTMRAWQSLKYKLPLLISTLLCAVVIAVCWSGYRQLQEILIRTEAGRLTSSAQRLADMLAESSRRMRHDVRRLAADPAIVAFVSQPTAATEAVAQRILMRQQGGASRPVALLLVGRDGEPLMTVGSPPPAGAAAPRPSPAPPVAAAGPVTATRAGAWVAPLYRGDSTVLYQVTAPVLGTGGDTLGYLVEHRQLSTGQGAAQLSGVIGPHASLRIGNAAGGVWTDLTGPVAGPTATVPVGFASEYATADGTRWLGVVRPIPTTPWSLWVQAPRRTVLEPAARFVLNIAGIAALIVALGTLAVWLLSRQVMGPLTEISGAARDLARGDYTRRVTTRRADELGSLARSFNSMATQVEAASRELRAHAGDLQAANEELRESERRYRQLVEILPDAILVHRDGTVRFANPAAATLFGASDPESLIGRAVADLVADEERADVARRIIRAQEEGQPSPVAERHLRRLDGTTCTVEGASTPLLVEDGPAVLSILRDVSERKRLENRIRQAQKMEAVGQLAGGVAHDFNNLLTVITSYSGMLLTELPAGDPTREDIAEIAGAAERAAALTRQLLAFSRQQMLQPQVIDPNQAVADMERMLRRVLPADIRLETRLDRSAGHVCADPGQLEQVVMNLSLNARDAMPDGGTIVIETAGVVLGEDDAVLHAGAAVGPYVTITVTDDGRGMTEDVRARIYEPFFTTKEAGRGTGLGLATVYGIVQQSGGHIWCYSEPGRGTVFKVYLPRVDDMANDPRSRLEEAVVETPVSETILLAEDELAVRTVARRILERAGYTVLAAASGAEALQLCMGHDGPIHLLLTDMVMPDMGGRELATHFREHHPDAPVVYMSGYTEDVMLRQSVGEPGVGFVQKPFTPQSLVEKLQDVLAQPLVDGAGNAGTAGGAGPTD
jgi:PAS domain S-box-containing protein